MAVERAPGGTSLIDVLDRVLDKGIVIDAYVRVSLVGIDLVTVEARVGVASIETYLKRSEEHTSELQPRQYLVCRLLLEKNTITSNSSPTYPPATARSPPFKTSPAR